MRKGGRDGGEMREIYYATTSRREAGFTTITTTNGASKGGKRDGQTFVFTWVGRFGGSSGLERS